LNIKDKIQISYVAHHKSWLDGYRIGYLVSYITIFSW